MHGPSAPRRHVELALLALLAGLWGSSYLFIKVAVTHIPPLTLIAIRVGVAAVLLCLVVRAAGHRLPETPGLRGRLLLQAVFNSIAAWTLLAWGQQSIDSALAGVLNSTSPLFVFLIVALHTRHEPATPLRLVGALLGISGVVLIVGTGALEGLGRELLAQLAVLASAALYGMAAVHGARFSDLPAALTAAATMVWASAILIPVALVLDRPWTLSPPPEAVAAALALGVACTGLAMLLYFRLIKTLGSMSTASQAYLRAGVSVLLGVMVLGEQPDGTVLVGLVMTVLGVAAINARRPGGD